MGDRPEWMGVVPPNDNEENDNGYKNGDPDELIKLIRNCERLDNEVSGLENEVSGLTRADRGPTRAGAGRRWPTRADAGGRGPTAGRRGPSRADAGRRGPTRADAGRRGPTRADAGRRGPTRADAGRRGLTRTDADWRGLTRADAGWRGLTRAGAGWRGLARAGAGWRGLTREGLSRGEGPAMAQLTDFRTRLFTNCGASPIYAATPAVRTLVWRGVSNSTNRIRRPLSCYSDFHVKKNMYTSRCFKNIFTEKVYAKKNVTYFDEDALYQDLAAQYTSKHLRTVTLSKRVRVWVRNTHGLLLLSLKDRNGKYTLERFRRWTARWISNRQESVRKSENPGRNARL